MKEMWDERYSGDAYAYGTVPDLFFKEKIETLPPGKLFLPAEGEGRNAVFAARLGWQVKAVDYSEKAREKALKLATLNNVQIEYTVDDMIHLNPGRNIFDVAALIYFHLAPEYRRDVHLSILNSLKPGGHLILQAFNTNQLVNASGGPRSLEMLYTIPMLKNDFTGIEMLLLEESTVELDQGDFHQGKADIIRLFGRKI